MVCRRASDNHNIILKSHVEIALSWLGVAGAAQQLDTRPEGRSVPPKGGHDPGLRLLDNEVTHAKTFPHPIFGTRALWHKDTPKFARFCTVFPESEPTHLTRSFSLADSLAARSCFGECDQRVSPLR